MYVYCKFEAALNKCAEKNNNLTFHASQISFFIFDFKITFMRMWNYVKDHVTNICA